MLDRITPLILTYNEAPNIGRTLSQLGWARRIVVVDSFSDDETVSIINKYPRTTLFQRKFDCHEKQWNYGLRETGINSEWVLALDADYLLTPDFIEEVKALRPEPDTDGYRARFEYCVWGRTLRGSAYPPVSVLYRRDRAQYYQDGHTQRLAVSGRVQSLRSPILHDDRKSFTHWLRSQERYMRLEALKLREAKPEDLNWQDRLRRWRVFAPFAMFFYALVIKGAILDGRAGLYYAFQRTLAEMLLSLYLIEHDLSHNEKENKR